MDAPDPVSSSPRAGEAFPSTRWSRILGAEPQAGPDLEALALAYWRPVLGYVRASAGSRASAQDAQDLTQAFFAWLIEGPLLQRADPDRGRFRGFLKRALKHFLIDERRKERALKRGAGRTLSLSEDEHGDEPPPLADGRARTPDEELDELWRAEILQRAADTVGDQLAADGKAVYAAVFRDYYLSAEDLDYAAVAARYGISKTDVSNYLQHAKKRYRLALRAAVGETVGSAGDLEGELAWLLGEDA